MMNRENRESQAESFLGLVKSGSRIVGAGGQEIGSIVQVDYPNMIVQVPNGPLLHIPFDYIQDVSQGKVRLSYSQKDLQEMRHHPTSQYEQ